MMADDELKEFIQSRGMKVSDNQPLLPQAEELLESQVIYSNHLLFLCSSRIEYYVRTTGTEIIPCLLLFLNQSHF